MGSTELAANLFRATQTDEKLRRENIKGKAAANKTHFEVGRKVRQTIQELGGTMPEDLPTPQKGIKQIEREQKKKELSEQRDELQKKVDAIQKEYSEAEQTVNNAKENAETIKGDADTYSEETRAAADTYAEDVKKAAERRLSEAVTALTERSILLKRSDSGEYTEGGYLARSELLCIEDIAVEMPIIR